MTFYNYKEIIKQSLPIIIFASVVSIFTGLILESNVNLILTYPILLLILPPFNNASGDIANTFTSRLSTNLHLGKIKPRWRQIFLLENFTSSLLLRILISISLGIVAHLAAPFLNIPVIGLLRLITIILVSSFLSEFAMSFTAIFISFESYKRNLDPNNTTFPILTSLGDIIGVFILMLVSNIIG
jgi:mgtE-like transporter